MESLAWIVTGLLGSAVVAFLAALYLLTRIYALGDRLAARIDALSARVDAQSVGVDAQAARIDASRMRFAAGVERRAG